ncbi:DEAD/DEAH box helicase [Halorientalis regularis]|uniref:Superfamily II DNA or RNA helicase n=1 Tax=Halorientalis regularis TaxID=660518 RepID=A0A1G7QDQ5_9EURY|nr:DEAD/DEAH box helicase family protein [Halorientalis regularis]SDF96663.1 Superfamily II DNA or RNA helicase [Halorientalis regularis]
MGRRFPPPLFGAEDMKARSRAFVTLATDSSDPLSKDAFVDRCRDRLTKPDGERYSEQYMRRIVSTYVQLGVLRQTNDGLTVYQFAQDWIDGELDFGTFLWYAVKRKWAIEGDFPEGVEGLYSIHSVVHQADAPVTRSEIESRLAAEQGYEFNEERIRGYPSLLESMGALHQTDDGYVTLAPDRFAERFRNADFLWQFEQWLKREGPNTNPPPDRVKRDLAKYYMYRESGGHGRHRNLLDTARTDYLADASLTDTSKPQLRRSDRYLEQRRHRRELRDEIQDHFDALDSRSLAGLSTDVLERMAAAPTEREAVRIKSSAGSGMSRADLEAMADAPRPSYTYPDEFELYDWQREAADEWFDTDSASERGIAQVVTGAGKTVMALEIVRQWLDRNPDGVVTVVVPTKVLMKQWLTELVEKLNVPADEIGWAGGGHKDGFEDGYRILVSIVNSAVKDDYLHETLNTADATDHLLVADECHRYTGDTFSNIFDYPRTASLGLSATPLSDPSDEELSPSDELLLEELGEIYYELSYDEGLERGLIPPFRINYIGFDLTDAEGTAYERLSDQVSDAVTKIENRYQNRLYDLNGSFARKLQVIKESIDGPTPAISDYFQYTQERRELVADAVARQAITLRLLEETIDNEQKAIVFQERIDQLEQMVAPKETRGRNPRTGDVSQADIDRTRLYEQYPALETVDRQLEDLFFSAKYKPVMYHSGHRSDAWNDFAIEWFDDDGFANVMLSVKALIEGVDVPSADVGIVRVSSGSVRQRIQTLGRVLRTGEDASKRSELYVLYASDTVDADIFEKHDWRDELARADVRHLTWETGENAVEGELRPATEDEIPEPPTTREIPDPETLDVGDPYPGPRRGYEFSVDADGRPFEKTDGRKYINDDDYQAVADIAYEMKGGGTVRVNEANHAITRVDGEMVFLGGLKSPDNITYSEASGGLTDEPDMDLDDL